MLEPLRQYAQEHLTASGSAEQVRRRHAEHYVTFAERAELHLTDPDQAVWLELLEQEHDNLRAVLQWSRLEHGDAELGLRLAAAVSQFWWVRGHLAEPRRWMDGVLEATRDSEHSILDRPRKGPRERRTIGH